MITVTFDRQCKPWLAADPKAYGCKAGVYVDPEGFLVATDAHILAAIPCQIAVPDGEEFVGCLLRADDLKALLKTIPAKAAIYGFNVDTAGGFACYGEERVPLMGERFVNWRLVVPQATDANTCGPGMVFDPWLMARLCEAMGMTKNVPITTYWVAPERPALLAHAGALGLLMPGTQQLVPAVRTEVERLTAQLSQQRPRPQPATRTRASRTKAA